MERPPGRTYLPWEKQSGGPLQGRREWGRSVILPEPVIVFPARLAVVVLPALRSLVRERVTSGGVLPAELVALVDDCHRVVVASADGSEGRAIGGSSETGAGVSAHVGTREVAARLGVSTRRVRQLIEADRLPATKDEQGRWQVALTDVPDDRRRPGSQAAAALS